SAGKENPSNRIPGTGRQPASERPTQIPAIPASAIGVLNTRSGPKVRRRPSVTRYTPPSPPTSPPNTSVRGSVFRASRSAAFSAATIVYSAIRPLGRRSPVALQAFGRLRIGEREELLGRRRSEGRDPGPNVGHPLLRLVLAIGHERLVGNPRVQQVLQVPVDRIALAPQPDLVRAPVPRRVVGC